MNTGDAVPDAATASRPWAAKGDRSNAALGDLSLVICVRNTEDETGKTALVTGGNRGMGEQVCRELARAGWHVLLASRDPKKGESIAAQLRQETGGRVTFVSLDVTSSDSIADLVRRLHQDATRLDALVNKRASTNNIYEYC
ncbi:MAG: SDR family NAD(P)-dependent oxidoreductase [Candidatus Rokuibacteriota bacterium]